MRQPDRKDIVKLIAQWRSLSEARYKRSSETWEKLAKGELPQQDELIYSVYIDSSAGDAYSRCARDLFALIRKERI